MLLRAAAAELQRGPSRAGHLYKVAPAVRRVSAPHDVAGRLEVVEEQHHRVRVDQEGGLQFLLGHVLVVLDVGKGEELLQAHPQELLGRPLVHGLVDLGYQRHQAGSGVGCHLTMHFDRTTNLIIPSLPKIMQ